MAQVSSEFWARAKTKDHDWLINMLPFASLSFSSLNDRKGIYALISKDEDRSKPLILRKPFMRKKLQESSSPPRISCQREAGEPER